MDAEWQLDTLYIEMSDIPKVVAFFPWNDVTDRRRGKVCRQNKRVTFAVRIEEGFASVS